MMITFVLVNTVNDETNLGMTVDVSTSFSRIYNRFEGWNWHMFEGTEKLSDQSMTKDKRNTAIGLLA